MSCIRRLASALYIHRTYALNKGRLDVESDYLSLIDASAYFESIDEGEHSGQEDGGRTIAAGTPVNKLTEAGELNSYFPAFELMKGFCDEDFDIVFSTSYGFTSQTLDVTNYRPCNISTDGTAQHATHFVHVGGGTTNELLSTAFGKSQFKAKPNLAEACFDRASVTQPSRTRAMRASLPDALLDRPRCRRQAR